MGSELNVGSLVTTGDVGIGAPPTDPDTYPTSLSVKGGTASQGGAIYVGNTADENSLRLSNWSGQGYVTVRAAQPLYLGTSNSTRVTISSTGTATFTGLGVFQSGIYFSGQTQTAATGAATTNNELNHYEQGTWSPTLGGNTTYTTQTGNYTRIGRLVNIRCNIQVNVLGTGSTYEISGLPFTSAATGNPTASASVGYASGLAVSPAFLSAFVHASNTKMNMTGTYEASSNITSGLPVFGNGARVDFSCTYFV